MMRSLLALALLLAPGLALAADPAPPPGPEARVGMPPVGEPVVRKDWSWTLVDARGIALGGGGLEPDDVEDLKARGFRAVLNYRIELPQEEEHVLAAGLDYAFAPVGYAEEDHITVDELEAAADFIEESLAAGHPVYVHCTGGWHRSAAGVVAFSMRENRWRFDQAWAHLAAARPGIEPRFAESLLAYEAYLFGERMLTVDLWTARWDVAPGESATIHARVTDRGLPVEGVRLDYAADHGLARANATSDANGTANFTFRSEGASPIQFIHVRAKKAGYVDGYDRNTFWVKEAKMRAPTKLDIRDWNGTAEPGGNTTLRVRVQETDGKSANARITVTTSCATLHRDYTGWDGRVDVELDAPTREGTYVLRVHANRFPAPPVERALALVVGRGGPEPPCEPLVGPFSPTPPPPLNAPQATLARIGDVSLTAWGRVLGALAVLAALALGWAHTRKRA